MAQPLDLTAALHRIQRRGMTYFAVELGVIGLIVSCLAVWGHLYWAAIIASLFSFLAGWCGGLRESYRP